MFLLFPAGDEYPAAGQGGAALSFSFPDFRGAIYVVLCHMQYLSDDLAQEFFIFGKLTILLIWQLPVV